MPYADSSPERRNLTIISLAAIIYYVGGGFFDCDIQLPMLSLHFSNLLYLVIMYWLAFAWFLYAYYRSRPLHQDSFDRDFELASREVLWQSHFIEEFKASSSGRQVPKIFYLEKVTNSEKTAFYVRSDSHAKKVPELNDSRMKALVSEVSWRAWWRYPSRFAYYLPYALAVTAFVSMLWCLIFGSCTLNLSC